MIADCETCDRKQVPCKACEVSQRAICFICQGDVADPYDEAMTKFEPSTIEEVVDLIRRPGAGLALAVSREAAIALVENYAAVVASEAAIKATRESYDKCIAITDAALSKPLASPPDTAVSP